MAKTGKIIMFIERKCDKKRSGGRHTLPSQTPPPSVYLHEYSFLQTHTLQYCVETRKMSAQVDMVNDVPATFTVDPMNPDLLQWLDDLVSGKTLCSRLTRQGPLK
jgi:hypothetical protein